MSGNIKALKIKIKRAIDKFPTTIDVFRKIKNEFGECSSANNDLKVATLTGQYYARSNVLVSFRRSIGEAGATYPIQTERFLALVDTDSEKVIVGDLFVLNGVTYKIIDLGLALDVYFELALERVTT